MKLVAFLVIGTLAQAAEPGRQLLGTKRSNGRAFFEGADHAIGQKNPLESCQAESRLAPEWTMIAAAEICAAPRDVGFASDDVHHCGLVIQARKQGSTELNLFSFELGAERNMQFFTRYIRALKGEYLPCKDKLLCQRANAYNFLLCDHLKNPSGLAEWKTIADVNQWLAGLSKSDWASDTCAWQKGDTVFKFSNNLKVDAGVKIVDKIEGWFAKNWYYTDRENCQTFSTQVFAAIAKSEVKGREQEEYFCQKFKEKKAKCAKIKQFANMEKFKEGNPECAHVLTTGKPPEVTAPGLVEEDTVVPENSNMN